MFGSKEKTLQKTIDKATNKLSQQVDRMGALEWLRDEGTEEALFGLCKRFGITSMKGVEDEQEKHWVADVLVSKKQLPPIVRYMKTSDHLAFPLRVVEKIADHDKVLEIVDSLFATEPPGYVRMPDRRIDLLRWFSEWKGGTDDEIISRITPYLVDFDENSRFSAIEGLQGRDPDKIAAPLIDALLRPEEESGRIKRTIVEVLEKSKCPLGDRAPVVSAALAGPLADDYRVDGGSLKRR
ncbi:MAG: hypothetical protein NT062_01705 [Proteobacteria bacterium]|nr:hypothetical protein [Pseudomonadota bacterium]